MPIKKLSMPSLSPLLTFFRLLFYANPTWLDRILLCVGAIASIAAGVPFPLIGIVFGELVDDFNSASCNNHNDTANTANTADTAELRSSFNNKVLLLVYIAIATFVLIYTHIVCWNIASQRLAQRVRDRYLRSLLSQDIAFFDNVQAGEVSARLNGDIQAIETGTSEKVGVFLTCMSFCITAYVIAFIKVPALAGMLISLIPAFLLMALVGGHYVSKYSTQVSGYFAKASAIASEGLNNVGLVHALGANARLEEKFSGYLGDSRKEGIRKAAAAAVQAGLLYFISFSANALAYWQGSRKIAATVENGGNGTTAGDLYTVIFILVDAAIFLSTVAPLLPLFGGAVAAFERLRVDIDHRPTIDGTSTAGEKPTTVNGSVEFKNVSFTYPSRPDHPVLRDVSFTCEPGKLTAIVGLSGSGKSTVASLISRFYDPESGVVTLDGLDLTNLNVKTLRGFLSLVPQEPSLLDRSILENIALGLVNSPAHAHLEKILLSSTLSQVAADVRNGADIDTCGAKLGDEVTEILRLVRSASDLADASAFIGRLECGLATSVGSSGTLISGGQKQRIALARALVRDPKILILDEATAALDSASEQRIQAAISKASKGRTVVSIAHRLSTIRTAHKIIVMKTGSVLEQGNHEELMNLDGSYADFIRLQSVKSTDETATTQKPGEDDIDAVPQSGGAAIPEPTGEGASAPPKEESQADQDIMGKSISKTMFPFIRPYLFHLIVAFCAATIVGGTFPASGTIFGNTLGSFSPCNPADYIRSRGMLFSGLFFMLACVEFLANFTNWAVFGYISERLLFKVRVGSLRSLLSQPLQWHESNGRSPTQLLDYITKDGNALAGFSGSIVGTAFSVIINFVAAVILSLAIAWRIALVLLAIVPFLLAAGFMQLRSISRFAEKHAGAFSSSIGITVEAVSNIRTVAALSLEDEILQTYRRSLAAPRKEMVIQSIKTNVWLAVAASMGNILYAFAHWWGSTNVLEGRYSQTQYFIILIALLVSAQLWGQLFTLAPEISRAKAAISRVVGVLEMQKNTTNNSSSGKSTPDIDDCDYEKKDVESYANSSPPLNFSGGAAVEFRDVAFSYPARPNVQVVKSLSLSIRSGQFCALVGPSGAGKSTVLALLERFYSPSSGSITIDGLDISRLNSTSFRDEIAYVPQDNVLFQGTIKFNLSLGARPGYTPTDDEIHEACKLANIHETIMGLPQGYDTECGSNGSRLSGGQRQRLSIARALVRKPRLLLLDESTSALDAESEKALELGLDRAVKGNGVTVIAIAHRLRTIARADVIFLVEGGEVVDQGRHEELVERSESYRVNALHQMIA
ncbi:unnamed protein product [Periconia digitata]|uniref:Leptomycin B resistance protein pmd1 n=1 Tax=Periconia digitata TaxID=1303443 RepID=A0A9W4U7D8_9PLEO|nr:unnamed protein product [Periconia digitata]